MRKSQPAGTVVYQTAAEKEYGLTRDEQWRLPHARCFNSHNPQGGLPRCNPHEFVKNAAVIKYGGKACGSLLHITDQDCTSRMKQQRGAS